MATDMAKFLEPWKEPGVMWFADQTYLDISALGKKSFFFPLSAGDATVTTSRCVSTFVVSQLELKKIISSDLLEIICRFKR